MEIINLDAFKKIKRVVLDGQRYEVYGMTVGEFVDGKLEDKLAQAGQDMKKMATAMIDALTEMTNIPLETLKKQQLEVITALVQIAQGSDPTAKADDTEEGEPEKNG